MCMLVCVCVCIGTSNLWLLIYRTATAQKARQARLGRNRKEANLWQINLQRNLINVGVYAAHGMETFFHMNSGAERGETGN